MARIPQSEIERLKSEVSVERLVEAAGVALQARRQGSARALPLPRGCRGLARGHAGQEPLALLRLPGGRRADRLGDEVAGRVLPPCGGAAAKRFPFSRRGREGGHGAEAAAARWRSMPTMGAARPGGGLLPRDPESFARGAGVSEGARPGSAELIDRFKLGFANRTLGLRLPLGNRAAGAEIRARLQKLGVLRASGHEHFNGSLVVPVFDETGRCTEVYGRKITPNAAAGDAAAPVPARPASRACGTGRRWRRARR